MKKPAKTFVFFCLLSFWAVSPTQACQILTFKSAAEQADIIFIGTPQAIINPPPTADSQAPSEITFRVTRSIKTPSLKVKLAPTVTISYRGNTCYNLPPFGKTVPSDKEYLIFAIKTAEGYETFHPLPNMPANNPEAQRFIDDSE